MNQDNPEDHSLHESSDSPQQPAKEEANSGKRRTEDLSTFRTTRIGMKKESAKKEDLWSFVRQNTRDTISYVLVIAGLMMMFFDMTAIYGSLLVGIVFGLYFSKEVADFFSNIQQLIEEQGTARSLMIGGILLIMLANLPFLMVGIAIVGGLKIAFSAGEK